MAYDFFENIKTKKDKKPGTYTFLEKPLEKENSKTEGLERNITKSKEAVKDVKFDLHLKDANKETAKPKKKKEDEVKIKLGGLLGKVLNGDLASEKEADILPGLSYLEKSSQIDKEIKGEVVEKGEGYRVVKRKGEKSLTYLVTLPDFTADDKKLLRSIGKRAVSEINVDPEAIQDYAQKKKIFTQNVIDLIENEYDDIPKDKKFWFSTLIVQDMIGYGILDPLLSNDDLEEVMLIGTNMPVYVYHRKHGMCKTNVIFEQDDVAIRIIARIARAVGRRVDASTPLLDARLKDGSRVNATVAPVSLAGPSLTIRKFKADPFTVVDIVNFRTMSTDLAAFLWLAIDGFEVKPANVLVSGGTGSGKTTTLNCLGSFIPHSSRVISIEDTAELQLPIKHWKPAHLTLRAQVR